MSAANPTSHRLVMEAVAMFVRKGARDAAAERPLRVAFLGTLNPGEHRRLLDALAEVGSKVTLFEGQPESVGRSANGLRAGLGRGEGELDLLVVMDPGTASGNGSGLASELKGRLRRDGLLLIEQAAGNPAEVQAFGAELERAGYRGVRRRAVGGGGEDGTDREIVMAISDGRVVRVGMADWPVAGNVAAGGAGGSAMRVEGSKETRGEGGEGAEAVGVARDAEAADPGLERRVQTYLAGVLGRLLQVDPGALDPGSAFSEFGVDSIGGVALTKELNRQLGTELKPTVLFDYGSLERLSVHLAGRVPRERWAQVTGSALKVGAGAASESGQASTPREEGAARTSPVPPVMPETETTIGAGVTGKVELARDGEGQVEGRMTGWGHRDSEIAVIGMAGRFPMAESVEEFWRNLAEGRNAIGEVPGDRWDHRPFFEPGTRRPDRTISKWGGFLRDADAFDPLFFNLSGREAEATDPQHRVFLEACYHALEDAGYAGPSLGRMGKCGVYAGVEPGDYLHLVLGAGDRDQSAPYFQGNAESILAARISYFLDLKGPSLAVNTACSSSLVAVHLACKALANGDCEVALAGGVRVFSSEKAYLALGSMGMLSAEGQCKTFDANADGFVLGEAVGVVVLKPLASAQRDGDRILGVIRGSAINQDGKTNGITAPSSLSQTAVILEAYRNAGIEAGQLQYVEAHGTGTKLGDPIEVQALTEAFRRHTPAVGTCAIGSVKTGIGHTMAAAGVCSLIKVLLALRHRQIPASLNLRTPNPYIDFGSSPFFVNQALREWTVPPGEARCAAISSFGFSGTNAHLVVAEAPVQGPGMRTAAKPAYLVTVSAKTAEALDRRLVDLLDWLRDSGDGTGMDALSFTLNAGRGHFAHRCAMVVGSTAEWVRALAEWVEGRTPAQAWRGVVPKKEADDAPIHRQVLAMTQAELEGALRAGEAGYREKLAVLGALYVKGFAPDWWRLHQGERQARIAAPRYPFARERYWPVLPSRTASGVAGGRAELHPLVHENRSTLDGVRFRSRWDGAEFFLSEHRLNGVPVLPGSAYLEMAGVAGRAATGWESIEIADVTWTRPLKVAEAEEVEIRWVPGTAAEAVGFEVWTLREPALHARGVVRRGAQRVEGRMDLASRRAALKPGPEPAVFYSRCREAGLDLGETFRVVRQVWLGEGEALAEIALPSPKNADAAVFTLHPALLDGAFQTAALLLGGEASGLPVPFAVGSVTWAHLPARAWVHVRRGVTEGDLWRFDLEIADDQEQVIASVRGFTARRIPSQGPERPAAPTESVLWRSQWRAATELDRGAVRGLKGTVLLFSGSEALARSMRDAAPGLRVVRVEGTEDADGQGRKETPGETLTAQVRWSVEEDYQRLVAQWIPDAVIHAWTHEVPEARALDAGVHSVLRIVRALATGAMAGKGRIPLVFCHPAEGEAGALHGALHAVGKVVRLERPDLELKAVGMRAPDATFLLMELTRGWGGEAVRWRDGRREVRSWVEMPAEADAAGVARPTLFRVGGVYVISGGRGGLGPMLARRLARQYQARVVLLGRRAADAASDALCVELAGLGGEGHYLECDLGVESVVMEAMRQVRERYGAIHGVIHAAGVLSDEFLLKKRLSTVDDVLRPKVAGTRNLDRATAGDPLDFFVGFSSISGALGNVGQVDYAYANAVLDGWMMERRVRQTRGERHGRSVSVAWPLWDGGGMRPEARMEAALLEKAGLTLMPEEAGWAALERALRSEAVEVLVLHGRADRAREWVRTPDPVSWSGALDTATASVPVTAAGSAVAAAARVKDAETENGWAERTLEFLRDRFARLVKLAPGRIDPREALEAYGIDSMMILEFTTGLEEVFGPLSKTLLFEYQTLEALNGYFVKHHAARCAEVVRTSRPATPPTPAPVSAGTVESVGPAGAAESAGTVGPAGTVGADEVAGREDIAIIGVYGRFPMADELDEFWENLRSGRDCITEIPAERWDYRVFYDPEPGKLGKTRNKWGGFLNGVERFDAGFFNILPREAMALDPQERLFLETAWRTVEDAGYRRSTLARRSVGVFVGVMYGEYQLYGAGNVEEGNVAPLSSSYASIANRVSYFFNWHGPSLAVDTMCSSSLTAIHLACESLRSGDSELALAGGVNATLHPHKDVLLAPGGFAASDGRCRSFGEGGDGYVPGEGVGAVLLKPLSKARADGDRIHAVIRGSRLNHGGKTNGYTVPNPVAQAALVRAALERAGIAPRTLGYLEAHGTGTALGDPIEITGLTQAFEAATGADGWEPGTCPIGSVKSNIGHLESAAGIAGVIKVLLQMRHGRIAPSLHSKVLNPHIDFAHSPFRVPQHEEAWPRLTGADGAELPRRAGVSSFGAGGANAHVLLEEYLEPVPAARALPGAGLEREQVLVVLSAKTEVALREQMRRLLHWCERQMTGDPQVRACLREVAYTLQVGRDAFDERAAWVVSDLEELARVLSAALNGLGDGGMMRGNAKAGGAAARTLLEGEEGSAYLDLLRQQRKWPKLGQLWVSGLEVDWSGFHAGQRMRRVSLPGYPFAGERYWAPDHLKAARGHAGATAASAAGNGTHGESGTATADLMASGTPGREAGEDVWYRPAWIPVAGGDAAAAGPMEGTVLVFRGDQAGNAVEAAPWWSEVSDRGEVVIVETGIAYERRGNLVRIRAGEEADYERLVQETEPRWVINEWPRRGTEEGRVRERSLDPMFRLSRALVRWKSRQAVGVVVVVPPECEAEASALGALARSVAQEQPRVGIRVARAERMTRERVRLALGLPAGSEVRWRGTGTEAEQLTFEAFEPSRARAGSGLRPRGVWCVTGGLGGLGLIFAEHLARTVNARLVLVSRSAPGEEARKAIARMESLGGEVVHVQADVATRAGAEQMVRTARARFGAVHGVIHAAGVLRDGFLLGKTWQAFDEVLRPKCEGVLALDEATAGEALDQFVVFSSTASVWGNGGQTDYAAANGFLDGFAREREQRRRLGQRQGVTRSIHWSWWRDGGMALGAADAETHLRALGMHPIEAMTGVRLFESALAQDEVDVVPLRGERAKIARLFLPPPTTRVERSVDAGRPAEPINGSGPDAAALRSGISDHLASILAEVTQLPLEQIDRGQRFEDFGVDSIVVQDFNLRLARDVGPMPKTLLFEHPNLEQLASHLASEHGAVWREFLGRNHALANASEGSVRTIATGESDAAGASTGGTETTGADRFAEGTNGRASVEGNAASGTVETGESRRVKAGVERDDIAIIGLAGRYPGAEDLEGFWEMLRRGGDAVTEIPRERWDIEKYFDADPAKAAEGKMYCRWGAFLEGVDRFDPLFFGIAPVEAELMDPQERLFLEVAWAALEDAGYTRRDLAKWRRGESIANVGVFVGATTQTYPEVARDAGGARAIPTSLPWSFANRVSYLFNFNGPSMPVDTACSSSLTAIHLACAAIRRGECEQAIAGGVNLYLHPAKYVSLCLMRMLSAQGRCRTFGDHGDGFVPGEGVGAVLLKPLDRARADGDLIHGVIKGTAVNHGGRTNGYTVPNPGAQAELIEAALAAARIEARTLSYVEAHGTGTALGDPIEIAGLTRAVRGAGGLPAGWRCPVGSVKSNIGHLEAAAGIAGLTKVLLQMRHRRLVPSIHGQPANPNIDWAGTPFVVQEREADWNAPMDSGRALPRRAGISSFGAGGSNAHVIVEEFLEDRLEARERAAHPTGATAGSERPVLIVLSARNEDRLKATAGRLLAHVERLGSALPELASVAYTLQVGREAMEERVAFIARDGMELRSGLEQVRDGVRNDALIRGRVRRERAQAVNEGLVAGPGPDRNPAGTATSEDWSEAARLWVRGVEVGWAGMWEREAGRGRVGRVRLPGYAFARDRYWVPGLEEGMGGARAAGEGVGVGVGVGRLGGLVHENVSGWEARRFRSGWNGDEVVVRDHRVGGEGVLPGAAIVGMARWSLERLHGLAGKGGGVGLREVVWMRPAKVMEGRLEVEMEWREGERGAVWELRRVGGEVCAQGRGTVLGEEKAETWEGASGSGVEGVGVDVGGLYEGFAGVGLEYGEGYRVIRELKGVGAGAVWARLEAPEVWGEDKEGREAALVDGGLQSLAVLGGGGGLEVPFGVREVEWRGELGRRCEVWAEVERELENGGREYGLRYVNEAGEVAVRLSGLQVRRYERRSVETVMLSPGWERAERRGSGEGKGKVLVFEGEVLRGTSWEGQEVVRVRAGSEYERGAGWVRIRAGALEDYERLVREEAPEAVVHGWSGAGGEWGERQGLGVESVHLLTRALQRGVQGEVRVMVVWKDGEWEEAGLSGYGRSASQEQPRMKWKSVRVTSVETDLGEELWSEGEEVRYVGGTREERVLKEVRLSGGGEVWRKGGVYVISGGMGGLGRRMAEHALGQGAGRVVLVGRRELEEEGRAWLKRWGSGGEYERGDVSERGMAEELMRRVKAREGRLDGVIHAAGELRDGLIWGKEVETMRRVVRSKVVGAQALVEGARRVGGVEWVLMCSSTAGLFGNAGQSDYAYANGCLDGMAQAWGEGRDGKGPRVVSVNWPLWREGGMRASEASRKFQEEVLGMTPLDTAAGLEAMDRILGSGEAQCVVLSGDRRRMLSVIQTPRRSALSTESGSRSGFRPESKAETKDPVAVGSDAVLRTDRLVQELKRLIGSVLRLDSAVIETDADLSEYGFDSITLTALASQVNQALGTAVTPATLFEYTTLDALVGHLVQVNAEELRTRGWLEAERSLAGGSVESTSGRGSEETTETLAPAGERPATRAREQDATDTATITTARVPAERRSAVETMATAATVTTEAQTGSGARAGVEDPIVIVGMSGIFPGSPDLETYWRNLREGRDLITRAPAERWQGLTLTGAGGEAGFAMESQWGGFIPGIEEFDAGLFDISPREAELMDPQQRLFLQAVWRAIEDAGHRRSEFAGTRTGLFVGVAANDYAALLAMGGVPVEAYSSTGNAHSVLANRVSYFFDLRGPSEAIDTACSSSLVAMHRAMESLRCGSSEMAIVGGVNVLLSPAAFLAFGKAGMLSGDGRCKTFDERANGYVRGEGIGALVLKPLSRALRDGNPIYARVLGSAENHGGRVQSLTVPNPNAQAELMRSAWARSGVDPYTISCVEAHGTGTSLGDPIEVNGLLKAFGENRGEVIRPRCAVGSVKANIGHLETAAGIAGVIKVLLSMRHRCIPGNIHLQRLNPYIRVEGSPFEFPVQARDWEALRDRNGREVPRRAGVSSFGFGGANAHVLLEEAGTGPAEAAPTSHAGATAGPQLIVMSARTDAALREGAGRLARHLEEQSSIDLAAVAYTLQVGREPMEERLALVVTSREALMERLLELARNGEPGIGVSRGSVAGDRQALALLRDLDPGRLLVENLLRQGDLEKLARVWVRGVEVDWSSLWPIPPRRVRLPGYAFARDRFWVPSRGGEPGVKATSPTASVPASTPASMPVHATAVDAVMLSPGWERAERRGSGKGKGKVLVFEGEVLRGTSWEGQEVVRVRAGSEYERGTGWVRIRAGALEDYERLVREEAPEAVVHGWSGAGGEWGERQGLGVESVHLLTRALQRGVQGEVRVMVVWKDGEWEEAGLSGYGRSASQEQPRMKWKSVRVRSAETDLGEELWSEGEEVRYVGGTREERVLKEVRLSGGGEVWRKGGVYVISGGMGGLGRRMAEHALGQGAGRVVLVGRRELEEEGRAWLKRWGSRGEYERGDVSERGMAEELMRRVKAREGRLDGVIHAAGELRDGLIWGKEVETMRRVVRSKVVGAQALVEGARRVGGVEWVLMCSSTAGLFGNAGQSDYAYANGCLDGMAQAWGEGRDGKGPRVVSVNWPLWREGGMRARTEGGRAEALGLVPLETAQGLEMLDRILGSEKRQVCVLAGDAARIRKGLEAARRGGKEGKVGGGGNPAESGERPGNGTPEWTGAKRVDSGSPETGAGAGAPTREAVVRYLVRHFSALTKLPADRIRTGEPLERMGVDSIMAIEFSGVLEKTFGETSKTLLFEYPTLDALADYLHRRHPMVNPEQESGREPGPAVGSNADSTTGLGSGQAEARAMPLEAREEPAVERVGASVMAREARSEGVRTAMAEGNRVVTGGAMTQSGGEPGQEGVEPIAVIGMAGRYPQAESLEEFWDHLVEGRDCIEEVPAERWDYREFFDPATGRPGKTRNRYGGFLRDVDKFDAGFFGISPREAAVIDPQERIFLETAWNAVEDAGYARAALAGRAVGVFVGVMYGQYQLYGVEESVRSGQVTTLSSSYAAIANRVSYVFDWHGPSLAIDTMCSSSLMAIHLASESLRRGECDLALAGGVNVLLHPHKDVGLSQAGFLNPAGRSRSFGRTDATGYVAGEGVGAVVLKPLSKALADGDCIHGILRGSAVNHGGRTTGPSVPNPAAQAEVVARGLQAAGVDPDTLSYVEGAATGSAVGDPIEVTGLTRAFSRWTRRVGYCALGSVKANIGHLEAASGIAAVTKVLLQMRHGRLAPSIHAEEVNPTIPWETTPFVVNQRARDWDRPRAGAGWLPRRASVNSFGAGGSYVHLVLEEAGSAGEMEAVASEPEVVPQVIVVSARTARQLEERRVTLARHLRRLRSDGREPALGDLAYTLQSGREPMEHRLAFLARDLGEVLRGLESGRVEPGADDEWAGRFWRGEASDTLGFAPDHPTAAGANAAVPQNAVEAAQRWVAGGRIDWGWLHAGRNRRRVSLPGYPFARERHWFRKTPLRVAPGATGESGGADAGSGGVASVGAPNVDAVQPGPVNASGGVATESGERSVLGWVRGMLGEVLQLDPDRIDPRRRMVEYGLDSVMTAEFLGALERQMGVSLAPSAVVEHATLERLVAHLERLPGRSPVVFLPSMELRAGESGGTGASARVRSGETTAKAEEGPETKGALVTEARRRSRRRTVGLAAPDYLFVGADRFPIQVLYHFEERLEFERLRRGLEQVCEAFYPVNSRIVPVGETEYALQESGERPDFEEVLMGAGHSRPVEDDPETWASYAMAFEPAADGSRLSKFRLFQSGQGSVLSVGLSHAVADGYSFYYFMSAWAAACRGERWLEPDHARHRLNRRVRSHLRRLERERTRPATDYPVTLSAAASRPLACERMESFMIDGAQALASARDETSNGLAELLTENNVLTALVWRRYAAALPADTGELTLACPVDLRRLMDGLSPRYFGNAVAPALVRASREALLAESVAETAGRVARVLKGHGPARFLDLCTQLERVRQESGREALDRALLVDPQRGLIVTNVARFALDPLDFGSGPFVAEHAPVSYAGTGVIVSVPGRPLKVRLAFPSRAGL